MLHTVGLNVMPQRPAMMSLGFFCSLSSSFIVNLINYVPLMMEVNKGLFLALHATLTVWRLAELRGVQGVLFQNILSLCLLLRISKQFVSINTSSAQFSP